MKLRRALASVLAIGVLGTGCVGSPPTDPAVVQPPTTSASPVLPVTDPARLNSGGELRAVVPSLPTTWNPWHPDASDPAYQNLLDPLRSRAFLLDAAGVAQADPDHIANVDVEHGSATTVRLTLNPKAVWGDGTPVTARDWIATQQAFGEQKLAKDARGWDRVAKVTAGASDNEVVIQYSGVDPDWVQPLIDGPARSENVASSKAFEEAKFRADWVAGPFVVKHIDTLTGVVTFNRNPHWWGSEPRLSHLRFRTLPYEATASSFGSDELDWLPLGLDQDAAQRVKTATDAAVQSPQGTSGRELVFGDAKVLKDIQIRRALMQAIDPIAVAKAGLPEADGEVKRWANPLLLPNQPGYTDQSVATGQGYDPAAAREGLANASWFGSLTITVPENDSRAEAEASEIAKQLADVGVTLTTTSKDGDLSLRSREISPFPFVGLADRVAGSDPNARAVAERIASETEPVRRADLAAQVARTMWLRAETLPLYAEPKMVAIKNRLANLDAPGYTLLQWENVGWAR